MFKGLFFVPFIFKFSLSLCYSSIGTTKNFAPRSSDFNLINFLDFCFVTHQEVSETVFDVYNENRTTEHMKIFPSKSFLITLLVKVSEKVLRSRVLRLLVTTMFPQLSVRNTTFNKSSQLILYSARDKTF